MITLNRPATLNALTMNMINKLRDKFTRWLEDDEIKVIVIKGPGNELFVLAVMCEQSGKV